MLSKIAKLLLVSSAIAPVGLVYAWVGFMEGQLLPSALILALSVFLWGICAGMLTATKRMLEAHEFTPTNIEAADRENMAFLVLYLAPLFTSQFSAINWHVWVPTIAIFAIITATGYSYHFNPLIGILGWHFYKVSSEEGVTYVLITRQHLRKAHRPMIVGQLTEYILIELER